jgi:hypothetical protein
MLPAVTTSLSAVNRPTRPIMTRVTLQILRELNFWGLNFSGLIVRANRWVSPSAAALVVGSDAKHPFHHTDELLWMSIPGDCPPSPSI